MDFFKPFQKFAVHVLSTFIYLIKHSLMLVFKNSTNMTFAIIKMPIYYLDNINENDCMMHTLVDIQ